MRGVSVGGWGGGRWEVKALPSAEEMAGDRLVAEAKTRSLQPSRCSYMHRDGKGRTFHFQAAENSVQEIQVQ